MDTTADYGMGLVPIFCLRIFRRVVPAGIFGRFFAQVSMTNEELNALLEPVVADLGLELVGIEFSPGTGGGLLRVYIDEAERGVTIDDCERASREISALLDVNDPIAGHYTLEVSSPGLERPLFTLDHFVRFAGETVKIGVNLPIDGRRRFQGAILGIEGDRILIDQDGVQIAIPHANVAKARLVPDYVALGLVAEPPSGAGKTPRGKRKKA